MIHPTVRPNRTDESAQLARVVAQHVTFYGDRPMPFLHVLLWFAIALLTISAIMGF